jgi:DNA-binding XRE family transcriptional regulator
MSIFRQLRESKKMSQDELAKFLNLSQAAVSKWEAGRGFPEIHIGFKLCEFFDVSMDTLYGNPHAKPIDTEYSLSPAEQRAVDLLRELPDDSYRYEVIGVVRQTVDRIRTGQPGKR